MVSTNLTAFRKAITSSWCSNAKMYVEQQQDEHKGMVKVNVLNAKADTARHVADVFLQVCLWRQYQGADCGSDGRGEGEWKIEIVSHWSIKKLSALLADSFLIEIGFETFCFSVLFLPFHLHFLHLSEEVGSEDEVVELLVGRSHYLVFVALPFLVTLVDEADVLTDAHHRVHIVGIDDGCHIVILGDAREEFVDDERSLWVETRVRFIAEEVFRIDHDGTGNGYTFLHTTRDLARILLLGVYQVDAVETFLCSS